MTIGVPGAVVHEYAANRLSHDDRTPGPNRVDDDADWERIVRAVAVPCTKDCPPFSTPTSLRRALDSLRCSRSGHASALAT